LFFSKSFIILEKNIKMKSLIIVDVQNDFFEGGALAVPDSNSIIPVINGLQDKFESIIVTKDWHPVNHKSFASNHPGKNVFDVIDLNGIQQVLWPDHCIQVFPGSDIHNDINIQKDKANFFYKGMDPEYDSYSIFFDNAKKHCSGLDKFLNVNNIKELFICGLATDYCVKYSVIDAIDLGFKANVIADATKAVNQDPGDYDKAIAEMKEKGATIIQSDSI